MIDTKVTEFCRNMGQRDLEVLEKKQSQRGQNRGR